MKLSKTINSWIIINSELDHVSGNGLRCHPGTNRQRHVDSEPDCLSRPLWVYINRFMVLSGQTGWAARTDCSGKMTAVALAAIDDAGQGRGHHILGPREQVAQQAQL